MDAVYVDFEYYGNVYDGKLPEETFDELVKEQCRYLDIPTFYRLQDQNYFVSDEDWDKVKYCICEMIDAQKKFNDKIEAKQSAVPNGVKSESIDGFSKTYITEAELETMKKTFQDEMNKLIRGRIGITGLLSRGV